MPTNKRVSCYVRVSTENQLENYSIDEQTDRLKAYCKAKDLTIVKFYVDGGYSGGNMNRPGLQQMLKDINDKHIDMVVVYKLDRLSRSQKDTLTLIEDEFLTNDIDFISMSENFDTSTPFGKAMIGILSVFAQLEKDQITERFTMGRIGRAKNGYYHGGPTAPTGYDYVDGELVVNDYEALQIREVFKRFLDGHSIHAIQKHMSENYTNKYGNWSSHTLVLNILRNQVYTGKVKFKSNVYDGKHEPIIPEDTFLEVQKLLTSSKRDGSKTIFQKNPFRANTLLTSLIYCKKCGARFCGNHGNYVCYSRGKTDKRKIIDPNCKNKRWNIEAFNKVVTDEIYEIALNESYFNKVVKGKTAASPVDDNTALRKRLDEIDKQINRMMDLYQVGGIPIEQISDRISKLKKEKDSLSTQLNEPVQTKLSLAEIRTLLAKAVLVLKEGELAQQRLAVSSLINYIEVEDEDINIRWKFL